MKYLVWIFVLVFALSCDDNGNGTSEPVEKNSVMMVDFFSSIDADNMNDCQSEDLSLYTHSDELVIGGSNLVALSTGEAFGERLSGTSA